MITLGLRATPKKVTFAIYDSEDGDVLNIEDILIPQAFDWPDALKYVRSNLLDILREYGVTRAGVRTTEPMAQRLSVERIQIEGVIQEAFASSGLTGYFAGPIAMVCRLIGQPRANYKPMVEQGRDDLNVLGWSDMSDGAREALIYAMGASHA